MQTQGMFSHFDTRATCQLTSAEVQVQPMGEHSTYEYPRRHAIRSAVIRLRTVYDCNREPLRHLDRIFKRRNAFFRGG